MLHEGSRGIDDAVGIERSERPVPTLAGGPRPCDQALGLGDRPQALGTHSAHVHGLAQARQTELGKPQRIGPRRDFPRHPSALRARVVDRARGLALGAEPEPAHGDRVDGNLLLQQRQGSDVDHDLVGLEQVGHRLVRIGDLEAA